jgi:hypothetical protein
MWLTACVNISAFSLNQSSKSVEPYGPQRDSPAARVIVHQYSCAPVVSLRFHSRKEELGASFKNVILSFF